jgi:FMN phosphatase YigB (HAD superfamily)
MARLRKNGSRTRPLPPAAIIFDIGRVIVRLDPRHVLSVLKSKRMESPEKIWADIQLDPTWKDWQEGRLAPSDWCAHLNQRLGLRVSFDQFSRAWNSVILPDPNLSDFLFARLSRRCRLVLLSNTDPLHVDYLLSHFTFMRYFPARVFSCRVGASKPETKIYAAAIHAAGVPPARILYVDDVLSYVRAGRRMGLDAIQFTSLRQLTAGLVLRNLL